MKLSDLAKKIDCRLDSPSDIEITGSRLEEAHPGQITFLANKRYTPLLKTTRASAVFVDDNAPVSRDPGQPPLASVRSDNPYLAFAKALELFYQPPTYTPGIHPTAVIDPTAKIGASAHIGPYCFVDENVVIGKNAVLHSAVSIYRGAQIGDDFFAHSHSVVREFCRIGDRVILQNGAVIGADGLGFAKRQDGTWHKIVQSGPPFLKTMSKFKPTPAWTAPPSAKRTSAKAQKLTTSFWLVTRAKLALTRCFAAKPVSPVQPRPVAALFSL